MIKLCNIKELIESCLPDYIINSWTNSETGKAPSQALVKTALNGKLSTTEATTTFENLQSQINQKVSTSDALQLGTTHTTAAYGDHTHPQDIGTFAELQTLINGDSNAIILTKNYKNSGSESAISINKDITINGNGYTIDANNKSRIFNVGEYTVNIDNIKLINGNAEQSGCIETSSSYINLTNSTISNSKRAITNTGQMNINNCLFNDNYGPLSGAIYTSGTISIKNCIFERNQASGYANSWGGAIFCANNNHSIVNCTFNNNYASKNYGAIYCHQGAVTAVNCQFLTDSDTYNSNVTIKNYITDHQTLPTASTQQAGIVQLGTGATQAATGNHTHGEYLTSVPNATTSSYGKVLIVDSPTVQTPTDGCALSAHQGYLILQEIASMWDSISDLEDDIGEAIIYINQ